MSNAELRKYRLTGPTEPTDEMLASLMTLVTKEVRQKTATAHLAYFDSLSALVRATRQRWEGRYPIVSEK